MEGGDSMNWIPFSKGVADTVSGLYRSRGRTWLLGIGMLALVLAPVTALARGPIISASPHALTIWEALIIILRGPIIS